MQATADGILVRFEGEQSPKEPQLYDLVLQAVEAKARHQISYWDAAIITAAQQLGCKTVYSEDLNHGQEYDGVRVMNPFLSAQQPPPT